MEFLAANWFYILIFGAMMYMMFRGGGCCGGGHASHDEQGGSYGGHHGGGCCGGSHMDNEHTEYVEHSSGYIENSMNIGIDTVQDPMCGMYVSRKDAVVRSISGRVCYFCGENCANEFERKQLH